MLGLGLVTSVAIVLAVIQPGQSPSIPAIDGQDLQRVSVGSVVEAPAYAESDLPLEFWLTLEVDGDLDVARDVVGLWSAVGVATGFGDGTFFHAGLPRLQTDPNRIEIVIDNGSMEPADAYVELERRLSEVDVDLIRILLTRNTVDFGERR